MSFYIPTEQDFRLLKQPNINLFSKVELLTADNKIMNMLEGYLISDDLSINNQSGVRRTYSMQIALTDTSFHVARDKNIWFDRLVRPYIGVEDTQTNEVVWYLMGTFTMTDYDVSLSEDTHNMSLNLSDLMCLYNDERGSMYEAYKQTIFAGEDVRTSIIGILQDAGITNYEVGDIQEEIPYDQEFSVGSTPYDLLNTICELFSGWEFFFDINGVFIWQEIPTGFNDPIIIDNDTMKSLVIEENETGDLKNVYNKTIVYGELIEPEFYSKVVSYSNGVYSANIDAYTSYQSKDVLGLKIPSSNPASAYININNIGNIPICDDSGDPLKAGIMEAGQDYVFRYRRVSPDNAYRYLDEVAFPASTSDNNTITAGSLVYNVVVSLLADGGVTQYQIDDQTTTVAQNHTYKAGTKIYAILYDLAKQFPLCEFYFDLNGTFIWDTHSKGDFYLLGSYQPYGEYIETDINCPYSVENMGEVKQQVMEVTGVYSNELAMQRAEYETYLKCKLTQSLSLTILPIFFLDVNQKITYRSSNDNEIRQYIINSITMSSSGSTASISLSRFYEDYSVVYKKKYVSGDERVPGEDDIIIYDFDLGWQNEYEAYNEDGVIQDYNSKGLLLQSNITKHSLQIPKTVIENALGNGDNALNVTWYESSYDSIQKRPTITIKTGIL